MKKILLLLFSLLLVGTLGTSLLLSSAQDEHRQSEHAGAASSGEHEHTAHEEQDHEGDDEHEHELEHEHAHEHDENTLALSEQALLNIGIGKDDLYKIEPGPFSKTFTLPAVVRYNPGRSIINIPASTSGTISNVYITEGETLCPGQALFDIQINREATIELQTALISLLKARDIMDLEGERLATLDAGIAPKATRELTLRQMENAAEIATRTSALRLLGFSNEILEEQLLGKREIISSVTVRLPSIEETAIKAETRNLHDDGHAGHHDKETNHFHQLDRIFVEKGQSVETGELLCRVTDLTHLLIEGQAYASDEGELNDAIARRERVTAVFPGSGSADEKEEVSDLHLLRLANRIDSVSQTLNCYVELANYPLAKREEEVTTDSSNWLNWRFKPGQRCELDIEYETFDACLALPLDAVAWERNNSYVFVWLADEGGLKVWKRCPVTVVARNRNQVVIDPNDSVHADTIIAARGASQLLIALTSGSGQLQSACPCGEH
ncbi:MAG: efflux RND transporter periplasmic adaptor subunit [Planctomycetia bacterium]|nr:efflux RND transporter periplasmic adaptor subunit [Planctomycetia bacterium]